MIDIIKKIIHVKKLIKKLTFCKVKLWKLKSLNEHKFFQCVYLATYASELV